MAGRLRAATFESTAAGRTAEASAFRTMAVPLREETMAKSSFGTGAFKSLSDEIIALAEHLGKQVVALDTRMGYPSSGTIWEEGYVVTADHVVVRDEGITVTLANGSEKSAELVGRDPSTDVALLKVDTEKTGAPESLDAASLRPGTLGVALSRNSEKSLNASLAVVNAIGGEWHTDSGGTVENYLRVDVPMYAGFSGGPLFDAGGLFIGMSTSRLSRQSAVALPAVTLKRVVAELKERGHVRHGYLGIASIPIAISEALRAKSGRQEASGLMILQIETESAGEKGGLLPGDILVGLGDHPVGGPDELQASLGPESVGKTVSARLIRGGGSIELPVTVAERPQARGGDWRGRWSHHHHHRRESGE